MRESAAGAEASEKYATALAEMCSESPWIELVLELLREAASDGNPEASYALATWFLNGKPPWVEKDPPSAIPFLEVAVRANIPAAAYDLAISYEKGQGVPKDLRRAFELYLRAALWGDEEAVYEVACCYFYGLGVTVDEEAGRIWMDRARALGINSDGDREPAPS
jgi:TPR repeat protein